MISALLKTVYDQVLLSRNYEFHCKLLALLKKEKKKRGVGIIKDPQDFPTSGRKVK